MIIPWIRRFPSWGEEKMRNLGGKRLVRFEVFVLA